MTTTATTARDLVAMVVGALDPAGLADRAEIESLVRAHRVEPYEAHAAGGEVFSALCEAVAAKLGSE